MRMYLVFVKGRYDAEHSAFEGKASNSISVALLLFGIYFNAYFNSISFFAVIFPIYFKLVF